MRLIKLKPEVDIDNLGTFLERRHKILIRRDLGGLGDILMHRMMFQSFKELSPHIELTFACPEKYIPAIDDHPFVDKIIPITKIKEEDYAIVYNTSKSCATYELLHAPFVQKHRSDIWAESCGVTLTSHDMHFNIKKETKPYVLFAPITAMASKNLDVNQCSLTDKRLRELGLDVFYLHHSSLPHGPTLTGLDTKEFIKKIADACLVICADTAAFHCAGGLDVPTVAVFGWADGKVYGKYFPKLTLVQIHRDEQEWCGPCYKFTDCPKVSVKEFRKPCITEITSERIWQGVSTAIQRFPEILE